MRKSWTSSKDYIVHKSLCTRKDNLVAKAEFVNVEELTAILFDDFYKMYDVSFYTLREIKSATKRDGIADFKTEELNTAKIRIGTPATWVANLCVCVSEYRQKAKNFIDTVEKLCEGAFADKSEKIRLQEELRANQRIFIDCPA